MKNIVILLIAGLSMQSFYAQNIADAVRYSSQDITGTARYRGASGAFGALGGDVSAINNNPAGSAIFNRSFISLSLSSGNYDNQTYYNDGITVSDETDIDLNQFGGVFVSHRGGALRKFAFSFNYDRSTDFDNGYVAVGNSGNSIGEYFSGYAQGVPLNLLELRDDESVSSLYQFLGENESFGAQQALLGYQGYFINPDSDDLNNTSYTNAQNGNSFDQEYQYLSSGNNSRFTFNAAAQVSKNLYLGINLNAHSFKFRKETIFFENAQSAANAVSSSRFNNELRSYGTGASLQLGGIYHMSPNLRLGATYDTPTYYTISEETEQYLSTEGANGNVVLAPNITNIYEDYDLQTPGKATGSIAYIFGSNGFISFDYSYEDYTTMKYRPDNDVYFQQVNSDIDNTLKATSTYKVGGEFLSGNWSFRGGYNFKESPYQDDSILSDRSGYTLGLGYALGSARIDIAYDWAKQTSNPRLFDGAFTNTAYVDSINTNIIATLSFQL
ncbi:OmpP1/FadL family transporter [Leeuwenhoekiella aequorea]|uniref:Long-subunit fatty acid transport protein n=1 Tax=Leeuwenhoekiella aequorea TaxID=283736 RepID=A0A4Q0P800_9FLAO|nr:transporter [Leeuwenhoekiella aequorea]RXG22621.1 long-subunit fatty acid transport protein [Leeuwenhoekiella aequorea]